VSFGFFSGFYGIRLAELQIDPQLESTIGPKARGLHSIWNVILQIAFSIWFLCQDNMSTIEDLQEKNSGTLENYSRRLQGYSRISWSTFQPRDASSTLEDFWLLELRDAQGLLVKAIKTTRNYPARLQSTQGLSYGHPWAHYLSGYQD
jgi:predicted ATP-grasp superfamily ATP-dependent carboligase